ncbi:MAG: 5-(carboxyamino)imidazole ribonucleotide synthase [Dichotomicrobium sp.]
MTEPLAPGSVIGILGGGQLGKMLAQAAAKLGFTAHVFAPDDDAPARHVAAHHVKASYDDAEALTAFARGVDVLTYEFESIPADCLDVAEAHAPLRPNRGALAATQDRLHERELLASVGAPVAPWAQVDGDAGLEAAFDTLGGPAGAAGLFLKTRRQGYDGKGQFRVHARDDLATARRWLGERGAILEQGVGFDFEFSVIAARGVDGACVFYDPPRNTHAEGRLAISRVPAGLTQDEIAGAQRIARSIMEALDYYGVLAVELFSVRGEDGGIRVNEIAPRVHNTGHWTIEACAISQFENHVRAIAGWPLGATARHSDARMVNIIGPDIHGWPGLIGDHPARSLHVYGKAEAVPGRKMGHYVDLLPRSRAD